MRTFEIGNKMWSIYADKEHLDEYVDTFKEKFKEDNIDERYDISKPFQMTEPFSSNVIEMYCIALICTDSEMDDLMKKLKLTTV